MASPASLQIEKDRKVFDSSPIPISSDKDLGSSREVLGKIDTICGQIWDCAHSVLSQDKTISASDLLSKLIARCNVVFAKYSKTKPFEMAKDTIVNNLKALTFPEGTKALQKQREMVDVLSDSAEQIKSREAKADLIGNFVLRPQEWSIAKQPFSTNAQSIIDCTRFALFHLHEEQAYNFIFNWMAPMPQIRKDYEQVKVGQPGDMILYSEQDQSKGMTIAHTGIYVGDNHVVSKWGESGHVWLHPIERIEPNFGDAYIFWRKKTKFAVVADMTKLLLNIKDSGSYAPYTSKGLIKFCRNYFGKLIEAYSTKMFSRSLYGKTCLKPLSANVEKAITKILKPLRKNPDGISRSDALDGLNVAIIKASDQVPLDFSLLWLVD